MKVSPKVSPKFWQNFMSSKFQQNGNTNHDDQYLHAINTAVLPPQFVALRWCLESVNSWTISVLPRRAARCRQFDWLNLPRLTLQLWIKQRKRCNVILKTNAKQYFKKMTKFKTCVLTSFYIAALYQNNISTDQIGSYFVIFFVIYFGTKKLIQIISYNEFRKYLRPSTNTNIYYCTVIFSKYRKVKNDRTSGFEIIVFKSCSSLVKWFLCCIGLP